MLILNIFSLVSLACARRVVHRRQGNGFTNPVEPTIVEDLPTSSHSIDFSSIHPSAGGDNDGTSSSDPTLFVQTTFPTLTGSDLITFTGTHTESEEDSERTTTVAGETSTATITTVPSSESRTTSANDVETTSTHDTAPTAGPGKAAAALAALLGLAAVL